MTTVEDLLSRLSDLDIKLTIDGEHLHVSAPQGVLTPDLRAELAQRKREIMALLALIGQTSGADRSAIQPVPRDSPLPLSFAEQRLWFLDELEPGSPAYHVPAAYSLVGRLNVTVLERAINEIVRRHEVLRTTFAAVDGEAAQIIAPSLLVPLPVVDLGSLPEDERDSEVLRLAVQDANAPFDLDQGPLVRARLLRLGDGEHVLLVGMHHIVSDGWSLGVFTRELSELYSAFSQGRPSPLPALPVQYADYAVWQRQWLQGETLARQLNYWRERLAGASELQLPTDRPRPAVLTFQGAQLAFSVPADLSRALAALSRREGVTLFMTLLAVFQTLLCRYSGQEDIVVGTPIANRDRAEIEGLIGFFANTLVLRTDLSSTAAGPLTFRQLLGRVKEVCLGAYANQHLPFEKLVEELRPERDLSRNPLFQVMFAVQNAPRAAVEMKGLGVNPLALDYGNVRFDVECHLREEGEGIRGTLIYNTNLFDGATMERMVGHYLSLLQGAVTNLEQGISELPLMSEAERRQVLVEWNQTQTEYPRDMCVHQLFEAQVERSPDAIAVVFGDEQLTYRELNSRANQLAHYLQKRGVGPETLVGICVERSLEMVVGLLGILKAGGAYVPLDPTYPQERLAFMLADAGVPVLLTQQELVAELPVYGAQVIRLDADWGTIASESGENLGTAIASDNLAYVMYTSGSTAKPKGVLGLHRGIVNRSHWMWQAFPFGDSEVCCQKTSLSFVDSVWEIFGPLLQRLPLVLIPDDQAKDPVCLVSVLARHHITRIVLVPSLLAAILDTYPDLQEQLPELRICVSSGEALPVSTARHFREAMPGCTLLNLYGSSEVSADVTWYDVSHGEIGPSSILIGRPIHNTQIYILDPWMQPVPVGVAGEIYVGGDALARGYHSRPELTADRFRANPFSGRPGACLYRTGDLARYVRDGNIEFLGRADQQVKIRGCRVEPGEVEATLAQHQAVRDVVVVAREDTPGDKRLVAYVVAHEGHKPTGDELRQFLGGKLPDYMVPSWVVLLEALPLTPSGKVDRRALPAPHQTRPEVEIDHVAPCTAAEDSLLAIWQQVLGIERIGVEDSFFDLGGHSLLAVRLLAKIEKAFGERLSLATFFQAPTVRRLADLLSQNASPSVPSMVPIQPHGSRPPIFLFPPMAAEEDTMGALYCYHALARHLGADQPVYGLQPKGADGLETPLFSIEEMARYHVQQIRAVCPEGPYLVGGYSYGGLVAFETARQLGLQHQDVRLVALFDSNAHVAPRHARGLSLATRARRAAQHWLMRINKHFANLKALPWREKPAYFLERLKIIYKMIRHEPVPHSAPTLLGAAWFAVNTYRPQAWGGKVVLFRSETAAGKYVDPQTYGWSALAPTGLEVIPVPGDHWTCIYEPRAQVLAQELRSAIDRALEPGAGHTPPPPP